MNHLPTGAILLLFLADLLIIEAMSVFLGLVVAKASGRKAWKGVLVGLLLPFVGPIVWALISVARDSAIGSVGRVTSRRPGLYAASGAFGIATALLLIATLLPWGEMAGAYDGHALMGEAAPADTFAGLIAMLGSAVVLAIGLVVVLISTAWRRVAILTALVGSAWLLVTVDGFIALSAIEDLTTAVGGISGGRAVADVAPRSGLWLTMVAALFAIAGAITLALLPTSPTPASQVAAPTWQPMTLPPVGDAPQPNVGYGDGF